MKTETNLYKFGTYGPFELPTDAYRDISGSELNQFWSDVDKKHEGLSDSMGCYVFAVQREFSLLPWYVGKTEQKSFRFETVQPHKILHYQAALKSAEGIRPFLFLLPRLTPAGKFRKVWKVGSPSVSRLEGMLIEAALEQNPLLRNKRSLKHLTQTVVPGFCNDQSEPRTEAAKLLARTLGSTEEGAAPTIISRLVKDALVRLDLETGNAISPDRRTKVVFSYEGDDYDMILQAHDDED